MEQEIQQQFSHSVKIETNAKGTAQVTVHVHANDEDEVTKQAIYTYTRTIQELKLRGVKVAE